MIVNNMAEVKGKMISEGVEVLEEPQFHEPTQKWRALANYHGCLAVIELKLTVLPGGKAS